MADSIRRQIRLAAAAALAGLATTGTRVYASRVYPMDEADLPGLCVYLNDETIEPADLDKLTARNPELVVEGYVKRATAADDQIDAILQEVEVALAVDPTFGGLAQGLAPNGIQILSGDELELEKPAFVAKFTFQMQYFAQFGAPDVAA